MKKKFFLISQVFYPDEVSTAGLFTNLCETLVRRNIEVEVWCAQPSYNTRKKQPRFVTYNNINIRYLSSSRFNKNSLIGRIINYFTFSVSLFCRFLFSKNRKQVFTSTNPPFLGFLVAFLSRIKNTEFIYIIQDVYPEGLVQLKKLKLKSPVTRIWTRFNKYTFKRAKQIIIIGRDMNTWLKNRYPEAVKKTMYIPIWHDGNIISPEDISENDFIKENNLSSKFIVQYSGNMGLWNDMSTFGKAINKISDKDIIFTFIGDGIRKNELIEQIYKDDNVLFYPFQPKNRLNITLSACHLALVSLNKGLEGIAVPSKIMGVLAVGIPTIALVPEESEIAMIVNENKCGIVIEPGDVDGLIHSINLLKNNDLLRNEMGKNARKVFLEKFNIGVVASQYEQIIKQ